MRFALSRSSQGVRFSDLKVPSLRSVDNGFFRIEYLFVIACREAHANSTKKGLM